MIHVLVTWEVRDRVVGGYPDYSIFRTAATIIRRGLAPRLYDARLQYAIQREFVPAAQQGRGLLPYNHPPYEALIFVPFTYLPYMAGYVAWGVVNFAVFLLALWLLRPYLSALPRFHWMLWASLAVGFFPAFASLFEGQDSILVLTLYALAFLDLKRARPVRSGFWLAICLFKFQLVLPFLAVAVLTRRRKLMIGFVTAALGVMLANIALVGWHSALYYPLFVRNLEKNTAGGAIIGVSMPNLHGLVDSIPLPHAVGSAFSFILVGSLSTLTVLGVAYTIHRNKTSLERDDLSFSLPIVSAVLVSYHCYVYDWTLLLLPALLTFNYLASRSRIETWAERLLLYSTLGLLISPLYLVPLARFGHLYGLALLLIAWICGLIGELSREQQTQSSNLRGDTRGGGAVLNNSAYPRTFRV